MAHNGMSGHYDATFNSLALGKTDEGWTFEITHQGEVVKFEELGENAIDLINRGSEVFVEGVLKEWKAAGLQAAMWPWSTTVGKIDCVGDFAIEAATPKAQALVLTAPACNPAGATENATGPDVITFHKAILAPDFAMRINLNNRLRMVPVRFMCFLTDTNTGTTIDNRYFTYS